MPSPFHFKFNERRGCHFNIKVFYIYLNKKNSKLLFNLQISLRQNFLDIHFNRHESPIMMHVLAAGGHFQKKSTKKF